MDEMKDSKKQGKAGDGNEAGEDDSHGTGSQDIGGSHKEDASQTKKKMFFTTSDLLESLNSGLARFDSPGLGTEPNLKPRFELQKRLPDGSTVRADSRDTEAADMESKFKQAAAEIADLNPQQRLEWAHIQRTAGNELYAQGEFKQAIDVYLTCLVTRTDSSEFTTQVFLPVLNNLAQCTLQLGHWKRTETFCSMALEQQNEGRDCKDGWPPQQVAKLYFRRAKARRLLGLYNKAKADLAQAKKLLIQLSLHVELKNIRVEEERLERARSEGRKNKEVQQHAMRRVFAADTEKTPAAEHGTNTANLQSNHETKFQATERNLYQHAKKTRQYSTLRARKKTKPEPQGEDEPPQLSCWQHYLLVIGNIARQLLIALGDEETIQEQQEMLNQKKD